METTCANGHAVTVRSCSQQTQSPTGNRTRPTRDGATVGQAEAIVTEPPPLVAAVTTCLGYLVLAILGHFRDLMLKLGVIKSTTKTDNPKNADFIPLYRTSELFFLRNVYERICDCFHRPVCTSPGIHIQINERKFAGCGWIYEYTGNKIDALNMGSYNYLGFAEESGPCTDAAARGLADSGAGLCASRQELGCMEIHRELERVVADFVGCEDSITFGMGFATNSMNIPVLVGKGCLIVSDELNHASLIVGSKLSGATVRTFRHNNPADLERVLRHAIVTGQPKRLRHWNKILVLVEGVYSMEGTICCLPEILELKKKYKFYLYLDEAHSIGAFGPHGRGVLDYYGLDPRDVDIMMGTFTKSFGAAGGYVAGRKSVIDHLRVTSHSAIYAGSMAPAVVRQIISSMTIIMGRDGTDTGRQRIRQLAWNTHYFRRKLMDKNYIVYGNFDSPVIPLVTFSFSKMTFIGREALKRGLAIIGVGYPATPLLKARIRFCMSAKHTKEDLDKALEVIFDLGRKAGLVQVPRNWNTKSLYQDITQNGYTH